MLKIKKHEIEEDNLRILERNETDYKVPKLEKEKENVKIPTKEEKAELQSVHIPEPQTRTSPKSRIYVDTQPEGARVVS